MSSEPERIEQITSLFSQEDYDYIDALSRMRARAEVAESEVDRLQAESVELRAGLASAHSQLDARHGTLDNFRAKIAELEAELGSYGPPETDENQKPDQHDDVSEGEIPVTSDGLATQSTATGCPAHVDIDLIRDDYEGPIPHAFSCDLPIGHEMPHSATVTWLDGEE